MTSPLSVGPDSNLMSDAPSALDDLRRQIDRLDDQLRHLLAERAAIAHKVGAAKAAAGVKSIMQVAREAEVIRRLVACYDEGLPLGALVRIWREIIGATLLIETQFRAAVYAPVGRRHYWDLARDHFGTVVPLTAFDDPRSVLRHVVNGKATAAVLPLPASEPHPWWADLLLAASPAARIVARLPFVELRNAARPLRSALVVAATEFQPSGEDHSYLGLVTIRSGSVRGLLGKMTGAGLTPVFHADTPHPADQDSWLHIVEVEGFVPENDPRASALIAQSGGEVRRVVPMGGFAVPLVLHAAAEAMSQSTAETAPNRA